MPRPLVARDDDVAAVRAAVHGVRVTGGLRAVILEAAPGMGASALAHVAEAEAGVVGAAVVHVPVDAGPLPALEPEGPAVLIVEWLHRAEPGVVDVLRRTVAIAVRESRPAAVVVTTGDITCPPGRELVVDLLAAGAEYRVLCPLTDVQAVQVAEQELGATCGPMLRRALVRAGGVPAAIVELLAGFRRDDRIVVRDGVADVESDALPTALRDAVLRRLDGIGLASVDVLQVAAALGPVVDVADLALVLGRSVVDVVRDLAPIDGEQLLVHDGSRLSFRHQLLRDALYESLAPAVRDAVHAEIASVLAAEHPAERVAPHLVAAGDAAPPALAADVAWALRRDAPGLALAVADAALAGGVADESVRDRLAASTVWPLVTSGRLGDALATATAVLARPHADATDIELRWCLVAALQRQGDAERARDELGRLLEHPHLDPTERHRLRIRLPGAHVLCGDLVAAESAAEELVADPAIGTDADVTVATATARVFGRLARGDVAGAVAIADETDVVRRRQPLPVEGVAIARPIALVEADRFDDARAVLRAQIELDAGRADESLLTVYDIWLLVVDVLAGAWDDAAAVADDVWQRASAGDRAVAAPWALGYPAAMHVRRDDVVRAETLVALADRALEERGPQNGADVVMWARSLVLEARGATADAAALLGTVWDLTTSIRYFQSWRSVAPDLVRLSLAAGDLGRARAVTDDAEEGARRAPAVPSATGAALRCRGLLDGDPDVLSAAVEVLRAGPRRPDTAAAAHDAGVALAAAGRRPEAVAALDLARALATSMGARRDLRAIESRLSMVGAGSRRRARDRAAGGWGSLTARELEVVALVADGLSNPQIAERLVVSRHTVESHLKRVYLKVGVSSRAQLAAEAVRRRRRGPNT